MMLSFQNLHQFIFNLPEITSVVSSTCIRLTTTSVKKKPEIDVYCSESFLNTLEALKQSEKVKIFKDLQKVKFGPKFEDMQWIFSKDVNFRFTAGKSVNKSDFYISLDKNDLKDFYLYSVLNKLGNDESSGNRQMKILSDFETQLIRNPKWNKSFVSKQSFDENKQSSFCGNYNKQTLLSGSNQLYKRLVGAINSYSSFSEAFSLQKRGFKTKRAVDIEEKPYSGVFTKIGKNINEHINGFQGGKTKDLNEKIYESSTVSKMMTSESTTPEEKLKLKVSFAEGYMVAVKDLKKPQSFFKRLFQVFSLTIGFLFLALIFNSYKGITLFILFKKCRRDLDVELLLKYFGYFRRN